MNFIIEHQLNFMMVLGGICAFIFLFLLTMRMSESNKKKSFLRIAFWSMTLLFSDRAAYLYAGDVSVKNYWMVRIFNFLAYVSILMSEASFTDYLYTLVDTHHIEKNKTRLLRISKLLVVIGLIVLVISQFTGFYYTFDQNNNYVLGNGIAVSIFITSSINVLQVAFLICNRSAFKKRILIALFIFMGLPTVGGIIESVLSGVAMLTVCMGISSILLYFFALYEQNNKLLSASNNELQAVKELQEKTNELLHQTVEALASAIDAKDEYTHGHSTRVARYSKQIAQMAGFSPEECEDIYLSALLHDTGKIGIDDNIINKKGRLSDEEFAVIKQHPVLGDNILSNITLSPVLEIGARYHHERYDGTGYPEGLKGEDIPQIARIIAVADAYDAMTSKRSYRDQIAQQTVREEIVKGIGTQFDPEYARLMLHLIDLDGEFRMRENSEEAVFGDRFLFDFDEYNTEVSAALRITDCISTIEIRYKSHNTDPSSVPSIQLFDSLDGGYYTDDFLKKEMNFTFYGSICLDGTVTQGEVRKVQKTSTPLMYNDGDGGVMMEATISMVKVDDHLSVKISKRDGKEVIICALNDKSRYVYMAFTGKHCMMDILSVSIEQHPVRPSYIPRIAEEISYIDGPQGDIPNIQIDGWRSANSEPLEVKKGTELTFDSLSLPSAVRVWHCPIVCLFTSDDGTIGGPNYNEICFVRLDGESWSETHDNKNLLALNKDETFENWNVWKKKNKDGVKCRVSMDYTDKEICVKTECAGLHVENRTIMSVKTKKLGKLYFFLTGDQCAITNVTY